MTDTTARIRDLFTWAYAWRTADDADETDLSSLRASNREQFDVWLAEHDREVSADRWDEGHRVGQEYERESETTEDGATGAHAYHYAIDTNPYRVVKQGVDE
jgi:hypothetical protein